MSTILMKKKFFLIAFFLLGFIFSHNFHLVKIRDNYFLAERAFNPQKREKGLGGRKKMFSWNAMIFEFQEKNKYSFWMKGMLFDLDILWISDGKIVAIFKNIPSDFSQNITPDILVDKVLEIKAGACDREGIELGDEVKIF
ncbi:MAG: hypothetical protein COZ85_02710 [Candidatus Moranbacteria bacterium CG_4_8_14_3_um_filter_34_16]|nr:MAG: hypothetical protein COT31_03755 [Candidatus Moranbacteria bacterium CG08_land_8_20_14_0_20_34_16]PIW94881.1 MAG: hypothetical protein COZ85_02710 [Candidatus Moranbacteria bacterium CG_4_8_14_3_um_filter_34_16]PJA89413.1 MAG: hypothetical protein CO138_00565 [Candidatus Moranbacteria bacterium CG_4_9_14_3_um_filter_33_15]